MSPCPVYALVSIRRESPPADAYVEEHKVNELEARLGVKREETG